MPSSISLVRHFFIHYWNRLNSYMQKFISTWENSVFRFGLHLQLYSCWLPFTLNICAFLLTTLLQTEILDRKRKGYRWDWWEVAWSLSDCSFMARTSPLVRPRLRTWTWSLNESMKVDWLYIHASLDSNGLHSLDCADNRSWSFCRWHLPRHTGHLPLPPFQLLEILCFDFCNKWSCA